jgi:hypothetical protein
MRFGPSQKELILADLIANPLGITQRRWLGSIAADGTIVNLVSRVGARIPELEVLGVEIE